MAGQYDAAVVLAYLEEETLREAAATLPEVDAVIGGPTGQPIPPIQLGPTLLSSATNQGKFVVRLDVPFDTEPWQAEIVELDERFSDDAGQIENLRRFYGELADRSFSARETSFVPSGLYKAQECSGKKKHSSGEGLDAVWPASTSSWGRSAVSLAWSEDLRKARLKGLRISWRVKGLGM